MTSDDKYGITHSNCKQLENKDKGEAQILKDIIFYPLKNKLQFCFSGNYTLIYIEQKEIVERTLIPIKTQVQLEFRGVKTLHYATLNPGNTYLSCTKMGVS